MANESQGEVGNPCTDLNIATTDACLAPLLPIHTRRNLQGLCYFFNNLQFFKDGGFPHRRHVIHSSLLEYEIQHISP